MLSEASFFKPQPPKVNITVDASKVAEDTIKRAAEKLELTMKAKHFDEAADYLMSCTYAVAPGVSETLHGCVANLRYRAKDFIRQANELK
jgi:hypothetical protein